MAPRIDFSRIPAWLACLLLALGTLTCHAEQAKKVQSPADAASAAKSFYVWYLDQLVHDRDPLSQDRSHLAQLVTPRLLADLDRKINSADGLDADYFLRAQDYLDGWIGNVAATPVSGSSGQVVVRVALGKSNTPDEHLLQVRMFNDGTVWRVDQVGEISPK